MCGSRSRLEHLEDVLAWHFARRRRRCLRSREARSPTTTPKLHPGRHEKELCGLQRLPSKLDMGRQAPHEARAQMCPLWHSMAKSHSRFEKEEKDHLGAMELQQRWSFLAVQDLQSRFAGASTRPLWWQTSEKEQEGETECPMQSGSRELGQDSGRPQIAV